MHSLQSDNGEDITPQQVKNQPMRQIIFISSPKQMRQIWFIVRVHKLSTEFEIRIVSQNSTQVFTFVNSLVLCYEAKRFCLYGDNSEKPDDADRFITQFSH